MLLDRIAKSDAADAQVHLRFLHSEHKHMRLQAASRLVEIGEPAVEPLVNTLRERHEPVWMLAASVLVKMNRYGYWLPALWDASHMRGRCSRLSMQCGRSMIKYGT